MKLTAQEASKIASKRRQEIAWKLVTEAVNNGQSSIKVRYLDLDMDDKNVDSFMRSLRRKGFSVEKKYNDGKYITGYDYDGMPYYRYNHRYWLEVLW